MTSFAAVLFVFLYGFILGFLCRWLFFGGTEKP